MGRFVVGVLICMLALGGVVLPASYRVAAARTFTVDTTADEKDVNASDGLCLTATRHCSLRAAIQEANTDGAADIINIPAGTYTLDIDPLASGNYAAPNTPTRDLQIVNTLTINGAGAGSDPASSTIIKGLNDQVFEAHSYFPSVPNSGSTFTFNLNNVRITGGSAVGRNGLPGGGALFVGANITANLTNVTMTGNSANTYGGAIYNFFDSTSGLAGTVNCTTCSITNNLAQYAGAIVNDPKGAMTLTNSTVSGNVATGDSAGAVRNTGNLTITGSTFDGNRAGISTPSAALTGGAIYSGAASILAVPVASTLTISDSTFTNNSLAREGQISNGGAIVNGTLGTATLTRVTMIGNSAYEGGAIINNEGSLTITQSTLRGNTAFFGAAIYNETFAPQSTPTTTLTLVQSTLSGNTAVNTNCPLAITGGVACGLGGAIESENSTTTLVNSTVSGNTAAVDGGGIYNLRDGNGTIANANLTVLNSTIANNSAARSGGGVLSGGTTTYRNTIVGMNTDTTPGYANCLYTVQAVTTSNGNNLDSGNGCGFGQSTDRHGNPGLGPLQNNGNIGPTETLALLPGSPAIDAGDATTCRAAPVSGVDQRGVTRPQGPACDIGAYETAPNPTVTLFGISPITGPTTGGTSVTISGGNFVAGASVTFGGVAATSVTVVNSTTIIAVTPANTSAVVDVVVANAGAASVRLARAYTYVEVTPSRHPASATTVAAPVVAPPVRLPSGTTAAPPDVVPIRRR